MFQPRGDLLGLSFGLAGFSSGQFEDRVAVARLHAGGLVSTHLEIRVARLISGFLISQTSLRGSH